MSSPLEVWFITGSQHLYGEAALKQVAANAQQVVNGLNAAKLPLNIVFKPIVTTPDAITAGARSAPAVRGISRRTRSASQSEAAAGTSPREACTP